MCNIEGLVQYYMSDILFSMNGGYAMDLLPTGGKLSVGNLVTGSNAKVNIGMSQFVSRGYQMAGIRTYADNVTDTGVTYDTSGGAQGLVILQ